VRIAGGGTEAPPALRWFTVSRDAPDRFCRRRKVRCARPEPRPARRLKFSIGSGSSLVRRYLGARGRGRRSSRSPTGVRSAGVREGGLGRDRAAHCEMVAGAKPDRTVFSSLPQPVTAATRRGGGLWCASARTLARGARRSLRLPPAAAPYSTGHAVAPDRGTGSRGGLLRSALERGQPPPCVLARGAGRSRQGAARAPLRAGGELRVGLRRATLRVLPRLRLHRARQLPRR